MSKVPLVVGLQKVIQAIKNWLPFTPGENAITYAPYGINFGTDTIVGIKGYRIIDMQPAREVLDDTTNVLVEEGGTYTLELEPGETIDERILNQEYTIYIKATSERVGVIEKIEGNVVTVKPFYWPNGWPDHVEDIGEGEGAILGQQYYYDNSFFICDSVPDAGNKYFGDGAYAEGNGTKAHGFVTHAEGSETVALGKAAHTEGIDTYAGYAGHAQNKSTKAIGLHSHAQNYYATAKGDNSDAGGYGTKANGKNSVTRGEYTEADGKNAIANGQKTKAKGDNSDAGGFETETEGLYSFGRGYQNKAKHKGSALFGRNHTSSRDMQFLAGQFADTSDTNIMAAVGVGTSNNARKNGLAVYADGRVRAGKGGTSGNDLVTVDQLNNTHFPQTNKVISTSNSEGWYQIAKGSNIKPISGIFKVTAQIQAGGLWSEVIFVASKAFNTNGKVTIINEQSHTNGEAIDEVRLRYTNSTTNSDVYVDVHCRNNNISTTDTVTISVELIDSIKTDKLTGGLWNLTDIIQEPSAGWTCFKQITAKQILTINSNGSGNIWTPSSPSNDAIANAGYVNRIANKVTEPLDQRLSFLEGGLLEYNEDVQLEWAWGECPDAAETGWCFYSPIEENNPYTKLRLNSIRTLPTQLSVEYTTVSYIDGVSANGLKRERLFTLDETTKQQIFDFVKQHIEENNLHSNWLIVKFWDSYIEVCIEDFYNQSIIASTQIPYNTPTNLIFDCKDYKYLDFSTIDGVIEPTITISKLGFKKES